MTSPHCGARDVLKIQTFLFLNSMSARDVLWTEKVVYSKKCLGLLIFSSKSLACLSWVLSSFRFSVSRAEDASWHISRCASIIVAL